MELTEAIDRKRQAETKINAILEEFAKETGLTINEIYLHSILTEGKKERYYRINSEVIL